MRTPQRANWLKEFQLGAGAVAAVVIATTVYSLVLLAVDIASEPDGSSPVTVTVPADYNAHTVAQPASGLNDRARLAEAGDVEVEVADPTVGEYFLHLLTWLPTAVVMIGLAVMLFALIRRVRATDPFTARTVRRLRVMGMVSLIGGTLSGFIAMVANFQLSGAVLSDGFVGAGTFPWAWLVAALAIFAIADVVAHGQRMREDLDGVI